MAMVAAATIRNIATPPLPPLLPPVPSATAAAASNNAGNNNNNAFNAGLGPIEKGMQALALQNQQQQQQQQQQANAVSAAAMMTSANGNANNAHGSTGINQTYVDGLSFANQVDDRSLMLQMSALSDLAASLKERYERYLMPAKGAKRGSVYHLDVNQSSSSSYEGGGGSGSGSGSDGQYSSSPRLSKVVAAGTGNAGASTRRMTTVVNSNINGNSYSNGNGGNNASPSNNNNVKDNTNFTSGWTPPANMMSQTQSL
jgi:hypothetical protein